MNIDEVEVHVEVRMLSTEKHDISPGLYNITLASVWETEELLKGKSLDNESGEEKKIEEESVPETSNNCFLSVLSLKPTSSQRREKERQFIKTASDGDLEECQQLSGGVNINCTNTRLETALIIASQNGYLDIVEFLLEQGANLHLKDKDQKSALIWACIRGHYDVAIRLVSAGADVNASVDGVSLLEVIMVTTCFSTRKDILELLKTVVEAGADVNKKNEQGHSPLRLAFVTKKSIDVIRLLLENGADVNEVCGNDGESIMFYTITYEDVDVLRLLLEYGANVNVEDEKGVSLFTWACCCGSPNLEIVKLLINNGAEIKPCTTSDDETDAPSSPLIMLIGAKKFDIAKYVVEHCPSLEDKNASGETALSLSVIFDQAELAQILVDHGANIDVQDNEGLTPLMKSVLVGSRYNFRMLLQAGADITLKDNLGQTALIHSGNEHLEAAAWVLLTLTDDPAELKKFIRVFTRKGEELANDMALLASLGIFFTN